jgi:5-methylcytosine-specific restriction endonuclease McrA
LKKRAGGHENTMSRRVKKEPVFNYVEAPDIGRERAKARELRESQWWKRQLAKGRCHYCGRHFGARELTMDHVVPISRGGKTGRGNVVPACKECNIAKKHLLPMEWEKYLKSWSLNAPLS